MTSCVLDDMIQTRPMVPCYRSTLRRWSLVGQHSSRYTRKTHCLDGLETLIPGFGRLLA